MKKFKAKIYLKNKKELNEYLKNLVKIKKNPTLEDVKFSFKWEQSLVTNNYHLEISGKKKMWRKYNYK